MRSFAGQAALAVEFARVTADRQRLAVLEDRTRIAEDLHDLVIQRLFAVGLGLQGLAMRVGSDAARERLSSFIDDLDGTIRAIRQTIFSLQEPETGATGLRGEALRVVTEAASALGFEPELTFEGPLDSTVPEKSVPEVLAVLREALSNVARHAQRHHGARGAGGGPRALAAHPRRRGRRRRARPPATCPASGRRRWRRGRAGSAAAASSRPGPAAVPAWPGGRPRRPQLTRAQDSSHEQ